MPVKAVVIEIPQTVLVTGPVGLVNRPRAMQLLKEAHISLAL